MARPSKRLALLLQQSPMRRQPDPPASSPLFPMHCFRAPGCQSASRSPLSSPKAQSSAHYRHLLSAWPDLRQLQPAQLVSLHHSVCRGLFVVPAIPDHHQSASRDNQYRCRHSPHQRIYPLLRGRHRYYSTRRIVEGRQNARRPRDEPARFRDRGRTLRTLLNVRFQARGFIGAQHAVQPRMNRSFVRMLHSSLSLLDSSAMLRSSPPSGGAHAIAWCPPSPATAAMLRRSRCSPIPLLASGVRADLSRREHLLPCAPSPPPERARASSPPARPFHRALPPPAVPDAFGVSCPSSLRPSQDSSPPRTARRARSVSKSASTRERTSPALPLQPSRDPPNAASDIAPTRHCTFGRVVRRLSLGYQR